MQVYTEQNFTLWLDGHPENMISFRMRVKEEEHTQCGGGWRRYFSHGCSAAAASASAVEKIALCLLRGIGNVNRFLVQSLAPMEQNDMVTWRQKYLHYF